MWRALRAELAYFRPWLLGGLGIAAFVAILLSALVRFLADADGVPSFLPGMFAVIAGMVVSFIAQSYRVEEHRARLLLAAPLTPRQLAWVMVLLPPCLVGLAALAAVPLIGLAAVVSGSFEPSALPTLGLFAGQFLSYAQMGPLAQEATAARRQRRSRAAAIGWTVFILAIPLLGAAFWYPVSSEHYRYLGIVIALGTVMTATVALYRGRTDFTR
jgi:hypothetical protein